MSSSPPPPLSILIVGCGIAGPTLASFLLLSPQPSASSSSPAPPLPRITILERASVAKHAFRGQNIDIRGTGVTIIRKLGLERAIRAVVTSEEGAQFVDSANRVWALTPADKSGRVQTGTSDIEILRGRLAKICYGRCKALSDEVVASGKGPGVEFVFGDYLAELHQEDEDGADGEGGGGGGDLKSGGKVRVRFAKSGETRHFDLVVGADGLQSQVRNLVWGPDANDPARMRRFDMYAGFFSMPRGPTDSLWRRWYHAPGRRGIMLRPGEPDGDGGPGSFTMSTVFMYIINSKDERLRTVVAAPQNTTADRQAVVQAQKSLLSEYFRDGGWECKRIVDEMNRADDFYYDVIAQVKMDRWDKGRVVLLGDAGYCACPVSGMGTTLGFNGAYALAGALVRHPGDLAAALAEYQAKMRPLVDRAQQLPSGVPRLMALDTAWAILVMRSIVAFLYWTGLGTLLAMLDGPPANAVVVEEYGFRQASEWQEEI